MHARSHARHARGVLTRARTALPPPSPSPLQGVAEQSDGAMCVFVEGQNIPLIVQKSDGEQQHAQPLHPQRPHASGLVNRRAYARARS